MNTDKLKTDFLKILIFLLFFCLISFVIEITFFNKDFFYLGEKDSPSSFDYYGIRHLAIFVVLILSFVLQKKQINVKNLKPYSALFLLLLNIIPVVYFLSKFLILFLSFLLFLYIKSDGSLWKYKRLLSKNMYIIVFFFVLFILFFPLFFKEDYIYDPLSLFYRWPGYRLSRVSGLETIGGTSDLFDAFFPGWKYTYQSIKSGVLPLWRYNKGIGISIYGQYDHPERFLSFIIRPFEGLTLRALLKLFLSMTGMFFLLRAIKLKNILCITGGMAYALSGFIIGWLHVPQSSVSYHIPFLFLFLIKYLESKKIQFLFYFALICSLTISSGFLAIAGYSFYAIGLFLILFFLLDRKPLFLRFKNIFRISLFWLLGIIVVAFNFIPLFYAFFVTKTFDISYRQIGRVPHLSPKYIANIIFPSFHGWRISPEVRPYASSILVLFLIIGLICFALRSIKSKGRITGKEKYYISFLLLLIPFVMAMFGLFPFYQISCRLPVLNSSPLTRLQSVSSFILVVVGVIGLDLFIRSYNKILDFYKKRKWIFLALVEILLLSFLFVAIKSFLSEKGTHWNTIYPTFVFLSLVIVAFQLSFFLKKKSGFFLVLLLLLVSGETIIQNRHYIPVNRKIHFITEIETPLIAFVRKNIRRHEGVLVFDANYNVNGTLGNYGIREMIVHEFRRHEYKALILDTFSLKSFATPTAPVLASRYTDFASSFIQLMGVKYLIFRSDFKGDNLPPFYSLVYRRVDGKVYRNNLYRKDEGIFFCKPKYFNPEEKGEVIRKIKSIDYTKDVYIEKDKKLDLNYKDNMSCTVKIVEYTPNKVIYRYRANSDGILTFPEAYDKDWSVAVDGKKAEVLETNLIFRGVALKKGSGLIVFEYHAPKLYKTLGLVGLVALLLLVSLYLILNKSKKQKTNSRKNLF